MFAFLFEKIFQSSQNDIPDQPVNLDSEDQTISTNERMTKPKKIEARKMFFKPK